ncbi:MAG: YfhO family protein [Ignavibacteria bacterium]|nr:YfhO family protein [Ignavibacteria bacterium]
MTKTSQRKKKVILAIKEPKTLPFWLIFLIFVTTTLIFFHDQILYKSFFWEDFVEYVFPVQSFSAKTFAKGEIPFWNPFTFAGMPFLADIQVGFFYFFNRVLSLFTLSGTNLPVLALEIIIILHFLISQINVYFLSRFFKISSYGSIISAVSYSFSMLMVAHIIHPMIVYHLTWLPLILFFFIKSFEENKIYYSILSGIILGFTLLSGHPQTTLYVVTLLGIVGIYLLIFYLKEKFKLLQILRAVSLFFIPFAIGFGIFAIQYLPSKDLSKYAQRNEVSYQKATEGALQFKQIYTAIVPKLFGWVEGSQLDNSTFYLRFGGELQIHFFWETVYYFGVTSAILGLFAILMGYKNRFIILFAILVVFGFLYSLGSGSPIFDLFYNLPYFGIFRNPGRMMFFAVLGMTILSGFGFDFLWKESFKKETLIKFLIPLVLAFVITLLAASGSFIDIFNAPVIAHQIIKDSGSFALVLILIIATIGILLNRAIITPAVAGIVLASLVFIDLYIIGSDFNRNPNNPEKIYEIKPEIKAMLTPKLPNEIFRVSSRLYEPIRFMALQRNQGLIDEIMLIDGYNPLILERVLPPLPSTKQVNDLYNVKYEVKVDLEKGTWGFVERGNYFPRAWFVDSFIVVKETEIKNFMQKTPLEYRKTVVLEQEPQFVKNSIDTIKNETSVICLFYSNNYFKYRVKTNKSALLVLSEIWYPDWKAYVDGIEFPVYRANYCFRAVEIPKGEHTLEMKYESSAFNLGLLITLSTLMLSIVGLVIFYRIEIGKHLHIIIPKEHK